MTCVWSCLSWGFAPESRWWWCVSLSGSRTAVWRRRPDAAIPCLRVASLRWDREHKPYFHTLNILDGTALCLCSYWKHTFCPSGCQYTASVCPLCLPAPSARPPARPLCYLTGTCKIIHCAVSSLLWNMFHMHTLTWCTHLRSPPPPRCFHWRCCSGWERQRPARHRWCPTLPLLHF